MFDDPLSDWEDGSPYDALAAAGVTSTSPAQAVRDASYVLMERAAMTAAARRAWEELRHPGRRLVVDFFMLHEDYSDERR